MCRHWISLHNLYGSHGGPLWDLDTSDIRWQQNETFYSYHVNMPTMTEQLSHFNDADFMDARSLSTDRPSEDNRSSSEITDDTAHIFPGREYNIGKLRQTESRPSTSIIRVSMEDITPNTDSIVIIRRDLKSWQIFVSLVQFPLVSGTHQMCYSSLLLEVLSAWESSRTLEKCWVLRDPLAVCSRFSWLEG